MPADANPDELPSPIVSADARPLPWLDRVPDDERRVRLFCLPCAGGSSTAYDGWHEGLGESVETLPILLPGRGTRFLEPVVPSVPALVEQITESLGPSLRAPYALFGHSYGALLAFEMARSCRRLGLPSPSILLVAGFRGPKTPAPAIAAAESSDDDLVNWLEDGSGARDPVFENPDFRRLFLDVLRGDLTAIASYQYAAEPPLKCPIVAFAGEQDPVAPRRDMLAWRHETADRFNLHVLPGRHLFVRTAESRLLPLIGLELAALAKDIVRAPEIAG
ncbi:MAG: thioesterase [Planctomycetaceae bacterium]|nr:thioesterase [Planctomycetaceae bacterium]